MALENLLMYYFFKKSAPDIYNYAYIFFGARGAADRGVESLRFQVSIVRR